MDRRVLSDAYEPSVHMHRCAQQTKIDIDPEYSRGGFCQFIFKSLGHHYHLKKERENVACGPIL